MSIEAVRIARDVPFGRKRPRSLTLLWVGGLLIATAGLVSVIAGTGLLLLLMTATH